MKITRTELDIILCQFFDQELELPLYKFDNEGGIVHYIEEENFEVPCENQGVLLTVYISGQYSETEDRLTVAIVQVQSLVLNEVSVELTPEWISKIKSHLQKSFY